MKLYDVPRNSRIRFGDAQLLFHYIDGMYSLCTEKEGNDVHPAAWTEVEIVK